MTEKEFESATDCVCAAVYVCENDCYKSFGLSLLQMVVELQPLFLAAMQQEDYMRYEVFDVVLEQILICRIFFFFIKSSKLE